MSVASSASSLRLAGRAQRIEPFYVMEVAKAATELAQRVRDTDRPMIFLNIGEPDFTAPPLVQAAAQRAIHEGATQYTAATGLPELRERCLLYTSPSPRDGLLPRMPSSA